MCIYYLLFVSYYSMINYNKLVEIHFSILLMFRNVFDAFSLSFIIILK